MAPTEPSPKRTALIPVRDFGGMTRLGRAISSEQRRSLSRSLADLAVAALADTSMTVLVLTADQDVTTWAGGHGLRVIKDAQEGLSAAVTAAVAEYALPHWLVMHADLPLVTAASLGDLSLDADERGYALAASVDGGTNVIAGTGPFRFAYGAGSFHRHLSLIPGAAVVTDPALAVEIDTEVHLAAFRSGTLLPSLGP